MGTGNPTTMLAKAITNVFFSVVANMGLSKYCLKYLRPAQAPPVRPFVKS